MNTENSTEPTSPPTESSLANLQIVDHDAEKYEAQNNEHGEAEKRVQQLQEIMHVTTPDILDK